MKKIQQHSITPDRCQRLIIEAGKDYFKWTGLGNSDKLHYRFNNAPTSDEYLDKFPKMIKEAKEVYYAFSPQSTATLHRSKFC